LVTSFPSLILPKALAVREDVSVKKYSIPKFPLKPLFLLLMSRSSIILSKEPAPSVKLLSKKPFPGG